jgi:hypothetical protein
MDLGFSRRAQLRKAAPVNTLNYMSLLAELSQAQSQSSTAQAQSRIQSQNGTSTDCEKTLEMRSFHPATAALLRDGQE